MKCSFLCVGAAALGFATVAQAASQYSIKALDSLPDTIDVYARGVNDGGKAVGYNVDADGVSHAVVWDANGVQELPYIGTNKVSEAHRINNRDQIVGKATADNGQNHATLWTLGPGRATALDIGTLPGGAFSFAQDINDNGVIAGSSQAATGQHAFTWTRGGGMVDNGSTNPGDNTAIAGWNGINNNGLLVGTAYVMFSPFKASRGQLGATQPTLMSPAGQFSTGMGLAINDAGTMVGYQNGGSGSPQAAIFNGNGTFQPLGHLGLGDSWAEDVNESGVIVGRAFGDPDGDGFVQKKSFVWEDGVMSDLSTLLDDGAGWTTLFSAGGINNLGQIVGEGRYRGEIRGFILTPVPEPATIVAIACGLGVALAMRRRRLVGER